MSSIYNTGAKVVCPEGAKYGEKVSSLVGTIDHFNRGNMTTPLVKWSDGHQGYMKVSTLITLEKYNQLVEAGFSDADISEYVRMYNGNIYN